MQTFHLLSVCVLRERFGLDNLKITAGCIQFIIYPPTTSVAYLCDVTTSKCSGQLGGHFYTLLYDWERFLNILKITSSNEKTKRIKFVPLIIAYQIVVISIDMFHVLCPAR